MDITPPHIALSGKIVSLDAFLFRSPLAKPRINSFGKMTHRSALIVRLTDGNGVQGWGECFANWPAFGADHRYKIITEILSPLIEQKIFESPFALSESLRRSTRAIRIQSDEQGPFDQSIAAVDIAAWDLAARQAKIPLYEALGGAVKIESVPVYASGLALDQAVGLAQRDMKRGFKAFKVKVGFGLENDLSALIQLRKIIGNEAKLMVDANQAWTLDAARENIRAFEQLNLNWVEEPIPADCPPEDFKKLSGLGSPIAAGENVRGLESFDAMMREGGISIVQPDIIKWGGISQNYVIAKRAIENGLSYCPHYLGGGIGLVATAHLLAAVGGDGLLELDASENPLRNLLAEPFPSTDGGVFPLSELGGLGVTPDMNRLKDMIIQGEI